MASTTGSWWEYSRWVNNIARNSRITDPTVAEEAAIRTFLKLIWNPVAQTGSRPWLDSLFKHNATAAAGGANYKCDLDLEPASVLVELLVIAGRDLKKIPMTEAEKGWVDALIVVTGNRRLGTGPYYGGVSGTRKTV